MNDLSRRYRQRSYMSRISVDEEVWGQVSIQSLKWITVCEAAGLDPITTSPQYLVDNIIRIADENDAADHDPPAEQD